MRIAFGIEYDGSNFAGWQKQGETRTVQRCIETALSRVADEPITAHCAGRTDAGVHALGQVIHIDTQARREARSWVLGANSNLPDDVNVNWAIPMTEQFHARFSATARAYRYVLLNRGPRSAVLRQRAVWEHRPVDTNTMRRAATCLRGQHDFTAFRAQACQANSPVRTINRLDIARRGPLVVLDIEANGFLQHMVRNIAGVLIAVGTGKEPGGWVREVLESRDRTRGGITAPAHGLYLMEVRYAPQFALPRTSNLEATIHSELDAV